MTIVQNAAAEPQNSAATQNPASPAPTTPQQQTQDNPKPADKSNEQQK